MAGKPIPRLRDAVMLNPPVHAFVGIKAEQAEQRKYQRSDHYSLPIGISYNLFCPAWSHAKTFGADVKKDADLGGDTNRAGSP